MTTPSILLVGLSGLLVVGLVAWAMRRRRQPVRAVVQVQPEPKAGVARPGSSATAIVSRQAAVTGVGGLSLREIQQRLHAVAFDDASLADAAPAARPEHAGVTAGAAAILSRIETQPRYAPRRPRLLPQLMRTVNDPDASGHAIAAIIGQDPALAARLLRIASSALYCVQSEPVDSIERAVAMVGTDGIRQIIAAALVQPVMGAGGGVFSRFPGVIWDHALLSAAAAADHAKRVEHDDAFAAQLLGLLYGLGSIAVVQVVRDQYARRPALAPDVHVAAAMLDDWAAPTAGRIARHWELSAAIGEALDDQQRHDAPQEPSPLARSLRFGRLAAGLAVLCRQGRLQEAEARAALASIQPRRYATAGLWERMCRTADP